MTTFKKLSNLHTLKINILRKYIYGKINLPLKLSDNQLFIRTKKAHISLDYELKKYFMTSKSTNQLHNACSKNPL